MQMQNKIVLVLETAPHRIQKFLAKTYQEIDIVNDATLMEAADVIVFGDGPPISLYEEDKPDHPILNRDKTDIFCFYLAKKHVIPVVGIGRGMHLIHMMHGGKFIGVNGHTEIHDITLDYPAFREWLVRKIEVPSNHTRICSTPPHTAELLGWSTCATAALPSQPTPYREPEIIFWKNSINKCLGFQWDVSDPTASEDARSVFCYLFEKFVNGAELYPSYPSYQSPSPLVGYI